MGLQKPGPTQRQAGTLGVTRVRTMTFHPAVAGALFGALWIVLPGALVVWGLSADDAEQLLGVDLFTLMAAQAVVAVALGASFWVGARQAAKQHSLKTLGMAWVVSWAVFRATNMVTDWLGNSLAILSLMVLVDIAASGVFGWRFAAFNHVSESDRVRQRLTLRFSRERTSEATHFRSSLIHHLPKRCTVGRIRSQPGESDAWFEITFPSSQVEAVNARVQEAGDLLQSTDSVLAPDSQANPGLR